jgi:hypothetical protein
MSRHPVSFPDLVIASGQTDSNVISNKVGIGTLIDFIIFAPATLTGTVTLYLGADENMALANMVPFYVNGSNVTIAAGKATPISAASFRSLALKSGSAEGATRTFQVRGQVDVAQ